jgi:hypothetical protein
MPQGQPIGGEEARIFLHAWRAKAQSLVYLAPRRDPSIALKTEYTDFYKSIGFSRSADDAKNAFGAANPSKKSKQAVSFLLFILLWFLFNLILPLCSGMQRETCRQLDRRRAPRNCCLQEELEAGVVLFARACMPVLTTCYS